MERYSGLSFTKTIEKINLSIEDRKIILFQLTHALYEAGKIYKFNHNDLIGQNIIININNDKRENDYYTITIEDKKFIYDRRGLEVKIIDFGFSRITINDIDVYNPIMSEKYYSDKSVPYYTSVDLCKIYGNPNLIKNINIIKLSGLFSNCKYNPHNWAVIPPFPNITPLEIILSDIFSEFRNYH
jgi:serine/threonine protein kinase